MKHLNDAGDRLHDFPRAVSFRNWPLLVLFVLLAGLASAPMAIDGEWFKAGVIVLAVAAFAGLFLVLQLSTEAVKGRELDSVHQNGIVWRRLRERGFVAWKDLAKIERRERDVDGTTFAFWELTVREGDADVIVIQDGVDWTKAVELIASRISQR